MKFRVESPEHSEKIQKKLFKMGYKWHVGPILQFLDAPFLFADEEGGLGWEDDPEYFESEDVGKYQEMQLVEVTTCDFVPVPDNTPEKDVVMFDGKEYDKEQFKELLKEVIESL